MNPDNWFRFVLVLQILLLAFLVSVGGYITWLVIKALLKYIGG